ncbi:MAG: hypothetical protein M0024_02595 [Nitrospiraceae bacterium]|nr:hypothetical protein [Nitrospiraceae bacterium]
MTEYWKCPECLSINKIHRHRCLCGNELSDTKLKENIITKSELLSPPEEPKQHIATPKKYKGYSREKCPFCGGRLMGNIKEGRKCEECGVGFSKGHRIEEKRSDDLDYFSPNNSKLEDDYDEFSFP